MKRIALPLIVFICTTIFTIAQAHFATKCYRVNGITGTPILPLQEAQPGYTCLNFPNEYCVICYELDPNGMPRGSGVRFSGRYTAP
jgi:hypothetical protein